MYYVVVREDGMYFEGYNQSKDGFPAVFGVNPHQFGNILEVATKSANILNDCGYGPVRVEQQVFVNPETVSFEITKKLVLEMSGKGGLSTEHFVMELYKLVYSELSK